MDKELLDLLACPVCKSSVKINNAGLACTKCKRVYPLIEGIPIMLSEEAQVGS